MQALRNFPSEKSEGLKNLPIQIAPYLEVLNPGEIDYFTKMSNRLPEVEPLFLLPVTLPDQNQSGLTGQILEALEPQKILSITLLESGQILFCCTI